MDSERIVRVGFCQPQVTKLAPSTTKRFLTSWLWFHLLSTLFFGSSPIRQVPSSWSLWPGGNGWSCLASVSKPDSWQSSSNVFIACFSIFVSLSLYLH